MSTSFFWPLVSYIPDFRREASTYMSFCLLKLWMLSEPYICWDRGNIWSQERTDSRLWHSETNLGKNEHFVSSRGEGLMCFSVYFLKSGASKRCKGWTVVISGEFTDRLQAHVTDIFYCLQFLTHPAPFLRNQPRKPCWNVWG